MILSHPDQCRAAYIQEALPDEVPNNILFQLSEEQVMSFATAATAPIAIKSASGGDDISSGPHAYRSLEALLPFKPTKDAPRMDPWDAIYAQIYREPGQMVDQWGDVRGGGSCCVYLSESSDDDLP
jgi:hypothetical protein